MGNETAIAEVAKQSSVPTIYNPNELTFSQIDYLGKVMAASGRFENARQASQAIVQILAGQELGISPITAMTKIYVVEGKIATGYEIMASKIKSHPQWDFRVKEKTDKKCIVDFLENKEVVHTETYTAEMAKRAGLITRKNWTRYPEQMLFARALAMGARTACPHVINNLTLTDELQHTDVNEFGEPIINDPDPADEKDVAELLGAIKKNKDILSDAFLNRISCIYEDGFKFSVDTLDFWKKQFENEMERVLLESDKENASDDAQESKHETEKPKNSDKIKFNSTKEELEFLFEKARYQNGLISDGQVIAIQNLLKEEKPSDVSMSIHIKQIRSKLQ